MPKLKIKQVDAFTSHPFGGNPAGVILDAEELSSDDMLRIAGEMNLAETAFIMMPSSPGSLFRIRYFTPTEEVSISGHATIACCYALLEEQRISLNNGVTSVEFETNVGNITVDIHFTFGERPDESGEYMNIDTKTGSGWLEKIMMRQMISEFTNSPVPLESLAGILGLDPSEINGTGLPVEIMSTGLYQLMIPVKRKETLQKLNPDLIKLGLLNKKYGIDTNHIFTLESFNEESVTYSRHFAPALGMWEDPATGTAAAGLATYLVRHGVVNTGSMIMEQGKEIESLARILVEMNSSSGNEAVQVGGLAVTSMIRDLEIDEDKILIA